MKQKYLSLILYIFYAILNVAFLIKYIVLRINPFISGGIVLIFLLVSYLFYAYKDSAYFDIKPKYYVGLFTMITFAYVGLAHVLNDPYDMNIDRWQTIEYALKNWITGKYFYDIPSFLGNTPSYLPGQLLMALPFYLIGNVGYLQVASFIFFAFVINKTFSETRIKTLALLLFALSLAYAYEVVCKSDFISSFIVVAGFILLWHSKYKSNYFEKPLLLGILLGILILTRSVVVLPLILFLLKPFLKTNTKNKLITITGFILTISLLAYSVLFPAKDWDYIKEFNPFKVQGQANIYSMLLFFILAVIFSFYVKNIKQVFYVSSFLIFGLMGLYILEQFIIHGIEFYQYFAVTYFAASLPFLIIGYCFSIENSIKSKTNIS